MHEGIVPRIMCTARVPVKPNAARIGALKKCFMHALPMVIPFSTSDVSVVASQIDAGKVPSKQFFEAAKIVRLLS